MKSHCMITLVMYDLSVFHQGGLKLSVTTSVCVALLTIFLKLLYISLLSHFSKKSDKLFNYRLDTFIEKHHLLSNSQYGSRSDHSTALAYTDLIETITDSIDKKQYAAVFIDLKKKEKKKPLIQLTMTYCFIN